ncbi:MAG: hypothetical protein HY804_13265 [Nitrospinae bacterium]|nr:hypothetical protein [Nitrospinota bacterium]
MPVALALASEAWAQGGHEGHEGHSNYHGTLAKTVTLDEYLAYPNQKSSRRLGEFTVELTTVFFQGVRKELSGQPWRTVFLVSISSQGQDQAAVSEDHSAHMAAAAAPAVGMDPHAAHDHSGAAKGQMAVARPYYGPLEVSVLDPAGNLIRSYRAGSPTKQTVYEIGHYFPFKGAYRVKVAFSAYGQERTAEFPVEISVDEANVTPVYAGAAFIAGVALALAVRGKAKA